MARFIPAIRPVYGEDEPTPGERLSRGLAGGLQVLLDEGERRRELRESDRREENALTTQGFERAPAGQPPMGPATMSRTGGIGQALGFHLEQQPANAGFETARTRTGGVFRRPGAAMRAASASQAEISEFERKEQIRENTESRLIPLRNANRPSALTFEQRKQLAEITAGSRAAATAATTNRGNASTQLQALTQYQTSLDRKVSEIRALIKDAQDKYRDDDAAEYRKLLIEAMDAADENREALKRLSQGGGRPALNTRPAPKPAPSPAAPRTPPGNAPAVRRPITVPPPVAPQRR